MHNFIYLSGKLVHCFFSQSLKQSLHIHSRTALSIGLSEQLYIMWQDGDPTYVCIAHRLESSNKDMRYAYAASLRTMTDAACRYMSCPPGVFQRMSLTVLQIIGILITNEMKQSYLSCILRITGKYYINTIQVKKETLYHFLLMFSDL